MLKKARKFAVTGLSLLAVTGLVGCQCFVQQPQARQSAPPPGQRGAPCEGGMIGQQITTTQAFPTGNPDTSVIQIEKVSPDVVIAGQEFSYDINVINLTDMTVDNVVVTEDYGENFALNASNPQAQMTGRTARWQLGSMGPQETRTITVKGVAQAEGEIQHCADVTYESAVCMTVQAVQPGLTLTKTAPEAITACDVITYTYTIANDGTGTACNVTITDTLPEGLTTLDGSRNITINAGDLGAGESREFTANVQADGTGEYTNNAVAEADGGLKAEASATTRVQQATLEVEKTARKEQYVGRPIDYEITVRNTGDAPATNVVLTDTLASQASFAKASHNGMQQAGQVTWNLGTIEPNGETVVTLTVNTAGVGQVENVATARSDCADQVQASAATNVQGIAALLLEVIDIHDPIEIGNNEIYEIIVTNQGSAEATNVEIVATLDPKQEYVTAGGASTATSDGKTVTFAPVPSIAPKETAKWTVTVKALEEADARFGIELNSDQLTSPVRETESTHMY